MTRYSLLPAGVGGVTLCLAASAHAAPPSGTYDCRSSEGQWFVFQFDDASCSVNGTVGALVNSQDVECHLNPMDGRGFILTADLGFVAGAAQGLVASDSEDGYDLGNATAASACARR